MKTKILLSFLFLNIIFSINKDAKSQTQMDLLSNWDSAAACTTACYKYNDIWGFSDNSSEYAIIGEWNGFSFIDITDPANPFDVAFISGAFSYARDAKTYKDGSGNIYAYLITDLSWASGDGLQIVNISDFSTVYTWASDSFTYAHNVYIDQPSGRLFLYGHGITGNGILMLDIATDPTLVSNYTTAKLAHYPGIETHDLYIKDDLLFSCAFHIDKIEIFDISNDAFDNKIVLPYPQDQFPSDPSITHHPHNVWTTEDGKYMVTADEGYGGAAIFWNIEDMNNITETDRFNSIDDVKMHNVFIKGNYCYIAHLNEGLVVLDISDIYNVIEVANYDTYPIDAGNYDRGAWGVYPFLPSCNIIISDMETGLYVVTFPQDLNLQNETIIAGEEYGYVAKNTITATNFTVETGARSTLVAKDEIDIGGESDIGGEFDARIDDPCVQSTFPAQRIDNINVNNYKRKNPAFMTEVNKIINGNYLSANYPNPFDKSTTIVYSLNKSCPVELSVYNTFGQKITELVKSGNHAKGIHHVKFDASELPEGVYFYTLRTGDYFETKKMSVMK